MGTHVLRGGLAPFCGTPRGQRPFQQALQGQGDHSTTFQSICRPAPPRPTPGWRGGGRRCGDGGTPQFHRTVSRMTPMRLWGRSASARWSLLSARGLPAGTQVLRSPQLRRCRKPGRLGGGRRVGPGRAGLQRGHYLGDSKRVGEALGRTRGAPPARLLAQPRPA